MALPDVNLEFLDDLATLATAFTAIIAMWAVGHQNWRKPFDMWSRRVILAVLAVVAMTHLMSPEKIPEVAQQFVLCAFLILIAISSRPRSQGSLNS